MLTTQVETLNVYDRAFTDDPFSVYAELRRNQPVQPITGPVMGEGLLATRYEDVDFILRDKKLFSTDPASVGKNPGWIESWWAPKMIKALTRSMSLVDDPDHSRLRGLVHQAFTPRRVQLMEERLEALCHEMLDKAMQNDTFDLMSAYALPIPSTIIAEMMGVPNDSHDDFHRWSSDFIGANAASLVSMLRQAWNGMSMYRFFKKLTRDKRENPQDDLTTALVQASYEGNRLSEDELIVLLFGLLVAGHETTANLIGTGTLGLLLHPQQKDMLRADNDLMPAAIEELLRWASPVQWPSPRFNLEDIELSGISIPAGSRLYPGLASANHDERFFENPATLDIHRQSDHKHLAFGLGAHYCIGAPLARLEGSIALRVLLERCPNLQLAVEPDEVRWAAAPTIRGLEVLPVRCG